jgi:SAM-dependent methyltransferase
MSFSVSDAAYGRFMGRYAEPLAPVFADFAGIAKGARVLDVGCGPGALTAELARRVGAERVGAVDPEEHFVAACRDRVPGIEARRALAEEMPFGDAAFGAALAQLVFHFVGEPEAAAAEMRRVVEPGGIVAACTWTVRGMEMFDLFWEAAEGLVEPGAGGVEGRMRMRTEEELGTVMAGAGLEDVATDTLRVEAAYEDFEDFWTPITRAPGPIGAFYGRIRDDHRAGIRERLRERLGDPAGAFTLHGAACAVRARVPS